MSLRASRLVCTDPPNSTVSLESYDLGRIRLRRLYAAQIDCLLTLRLWSLTSVHAKVVAIFFVTVMSP